MSDINNTGPVSHHDRKIYEQEYKQGADLFQRSLEQSQKSDNPYQKEQFGEVMDKAMKILNETARELKRNDLMEKNEQISKDYQAYKDNPSDLVVSKLSQDLDKAKRSI